jgi:hypothetical protein
MRITRTRAALAGVALAAVLAGCGQAHIATPSPRHTVSRPAVSVAGCTEAMEEAGEDALVQGVASGGTLPPAVTSACDRLPPAAMNLAVNTAMSYLMTAS